MMIRLDPSCPFNLDLTLCCGQTFRWDQHGDWWYGVVDGKAVRIRQNGDELEFEHGDRDFLMKYLGMKDDLLKISSEINKDKHIEAAIKQFVGLRILRQDPWECLISYICATYKNIAAIKRMLFELSRRFGEKISVNDLSLYAFPTPTNLAGAPLRELEKCGLGYRARYVSQTAETICDSDFELEKLRNADYEEAKKLLLGFPGVGQKVADCVLLFSLGKLEAFPVDVWVRRAVLRYYASYFPRGFVARILREESLSDSEYKRLNTFGREYFGKYAGYAQEYLYHYERTCSRQWSRHN